MKAIFFGADGSVRQRRTNHHSAVVCAKALARYYERGVILYTNTGKYSDMAVWDENKNYLGDWIREEENTMTFAGIMKHPEDYTLNDLLSLFDHDRDIMRGHYDGGVTELYFNGEAGSACQFVLNTWSSDDIMCAYRGGRATPEEFQAELDSIAHQQCIDINKDNLEVGAYWALRLTMPADIEATTTTMYTYENIRAIYELADEVAKVACEQEE